jgi:sugar phosphate isomerase/epimerase
MELAGGGTLSVRVSLEENLRQLKAQGFDAADVLLVSGWAHIGTDELAADWAGVTGRIERALAESGMRIASFNTKLSVPFEDGSFAGTRRRSEEFSALLRLMEHFKVRRASIQPTLTTDADYLLRTRRACLDEYLRLQRLAQERDLLFSLEPHIMSCVCTADSVNRALDDAPDLRFTYDPSHLLHSGETLEAADRIASTTSLTHLRDAKKGALFVPYGQGKLDLAHAVGALRGAGYDGPIVAEYMADRTGAPGLDPDILKDLQHFLSNLEPLLE